MIFKIDRSRHVAKPTKGLEDLIKFVSADSEDQFERVDAKGYEIFAGRICHCICFGIYILIHGVRKRILKCV